MIAGVHQRAAFYMHMTRNSSIFLAIVVVIALLATLFFFWSPSLKKSGLTSEELKGQGVALWLDNSIQTGDFSGALQAYK